jgi:hypothetical protein
MEQPSEIRNPPRRPPLGRVWAILLLLAGASALVPPWEKTLQQPGMARASEPIGYHLLILPPEAPDIRYSGVRIDFGRLALQWLALAALGGTLHLLRGSSPVPARQALRLTPRRVLASGAFVVVVLCVFPPWEERWLDEPTPSEAEFQELLRLWDEDTDSSMGDPEHSEAPQPVERTRDLGHALIPPLRDAVAEATGIPPFLGRGPDRWSGRTVRIDRNRLLILISATLGLTALAGAVAEFLARSRGSRLQ